jgi:hypothetical protein
MLLLLSLSACARPNQIALAAAERGKAEAGVVLPPLPGEFRQAVPHAPAMLGDDAVVVLARERGQLDWANGVIRRFAGYYDNLKTGLEGGQ